MNLLKTSSSSITSFIWLIAMFLLSKVTSIDWWSTNSQWGSCTPYHGGGDANFGNPKDKECQLVYVFGYFRHGTRLPTDSVTLKLPEVANKAKSTCTTVKKERYCQPYDLPNNYKTSPGALTDVGKNELYNIGIRLQKIINPDLGNIQLFLSKAQRARDSAISFFRGFNLNIHPDDKNDNDALVRYYRQYKIKKSEKDDFFKSDTWKNTLESIGKVVAFPAVEDEVMAMYSACSLGVSNKFTDEVQMWCPMLPQSALDAILYEEDAKNYWQYESNPPNMTDTIIQAYLNDIQKLTNEMKISKQTIVKPRVTLLFGHHGGVYPIIKRLKLYQQNDPLSAENYQKLVKNRGFNNTFLTPMASNVQLHVYHCKNTKQLYFHPYLNEKSMLHTVDCKEKTSVGCPQDKFSSIYASNHNPRKMNFFLFTAACFINIFIAI